jgi:hypothetical protein
LLSGSPPAVGESLMPFQESHRLQLPIHLLAFNLPVFISKDCKMDLVRPFRITPVVGSPPGFCEKNLAAAFCAGAR